MQEDQNDASIKKTRTIRETHDAIDGLYDKYANNPYVFSKIHNYVCNLLPNILEKKNTSHDESLQRIEALSNEQGTFIETFLNTNKYFYIPATEKFFFYDGLHYQIYNEDDILYNVLSAISRDRNLMSWKQLTKKHIMKRIKENSLLKSIPESETIQSVLDYLYPSVFATKIEAKYFLTILGDNIFKTNTELIHFIHPNAKHFIRELNNICQSIIGVSLAQTFKYKYHELHEYNHCRIIKTNDAIKSDNIWAPIINACFLDLLCVACHYSIRFSGSDDVIANHSNDQELIDRVFYLKDLQPESIIDKFIGEYLQISSSGKSILTNQLTIENQNSVIRATQVTWKNMQYLWKHFLETKHLPNIMFQQKMKGLLTEKLAEYYSEELDSFVGICSNFLPAIQKFLLFWNECIEYDEEENDFEIEEITFLFRKWSESKNEAVSTLNDKQVIDLISYYFPDVEIEKDKYISKIACVLWDKQMDIQIALDSMKERLKMQVYRQYGSTSNYERTTSPIAGRHISIYDAYNYYCKYFSDFENKQIVNKAYFEKFIFENLGYYLIDGKFISSDWLISDNP
jgi:hypothetical protein